MQDNIRITSPLPQTQDISTKMAEAKNVPVVNPIDPSKVNATNNAQSGQNSRNEAFAYMLNHSSVYNRFISQLVQTPSLAETLKKLSFDAFTAEIKPTKLTASSKVLNLMAQKLKLDPRQIVESLSYQDENQTKFQGKLFDELRKLLKNNSSSKEFEPILGKFLKAFNGFFSTESTLKAITRNIETIKLSMPKYYKNELTEISSKLILTQPEKSLKPNLDLLKNEIIPFLSDYIGKTNDFGKVRDTITLLINNVARFNIGSREDLINKFVDLLDFCKYHFDLSDEKISVIKNAFSAEISNQKISHNDLFDSIIKILNNGDGTKSSGTNTVLREISNSLLLDQSVFMPLTHLFLPLNYQGHFLFSELWIDKDATKKDEETLAVKPATKIFITFDIKSVGYFETIILLCENKADIDITYPQKLEATENEIKHTITKILSTNGFSVGGINVAKGQSPKRLQDVFSNMYERGAGIDVTI